MPRVAPLVLALLIALVLPALAVQPDEVLEDPALESRAREISAELRCMVCQNQSIDDSDAELARDLRILVRERLQAGDTDAEVLDYVVSRYGEFVLLRPLFSARNLLLWLTAPAILIIGAIGFFLYARRRNPDADGAPLSKDEEERLSRLLDGSDR